MSAVRSAIAEPAKALLPARVAFEDGAARGGRAPGRQAQIEAPRGERRAEPFRPFEENDAVDEGLLEAELEDLLGALQPVEVEMPDDAARRLIGLDEREGRARHL